MKVILLKDVKGSGKKGEVIKKLKEEELLSALCEEIEKM